MRINRGMKKSVANYLICLALSCFLTMTQALTLEDVELRSHLNQSLDARVGLSEVSAEDLASLTVDIRHRGPGSGYKPMNMKYEIKQDESGRYIHVTSTELVREPVLTFELELNWHAGRLLREYSLLIDPKY